MFIQIQYGSDMCENELGTVGWSCLALPVRKRGPAPQSGKTFLVLLLLNNWVCSYFPLGSLMIMCWESSSIPRKVSIVKDLLSCLLLSFQHPCAVLALALN